MDWIEPTRVVVAGDWHGALRWGRSVLDQLPKLLPDEAQRILLHTGDFGVWPGPKGKNYLNLLDWKLEEVDAQLWFVDGNHEDHSQLRALLEARGDSVEHRIQLTERVHWLPRGHRWVWHGRTWLALGGATSVDRKARVEHQSWWSNEALSMLDCERAVAPGHADVMLTHDTVSGYEVNPHFTAASLPSWWEMEPAQRHRETMRSVVEMVQPSWLIHGHFHYEYDRVLRMPYGDLRVTGLDCDGALSGNYRVLDVEDMRWIPLTLLDSPATV